MSITTIPATTFTPSAHNRIGHRRVKSCTSWVATPSVLIVLLILLVGSTEFCSARVPQPRKALLFQTLRQAEIDPNVLVEENNVLGQALNENFLQNRDTPIDLLSICRLECRSSGDSNRHGDYDDLQRQCTVEMFDLTQASGIAPPNVTLAFGSDPYAKNRDFIAWCHRLLTSSHFEDPEALEEFRREMVLPNPFWKAAVKATYLCAKTINSNSDDGAGELSFDEILQDAKKWSAAIQRLREAHDDVS